MVKVINVHGIQSILTVIVVWEVLMEFVEILIHRVFLLQWNLDQDKVINVI